MRLHRCSHWKPSFPLASDATPLHILDATRRHGQTSRNNYSTLRAHYSEPIAMHKNLSDEAVALLQSALGLSNIGQGSGTGPLDAAYALDRQKNDGLGRSDSLAGESPAHRESNRPPVMDIFRAAVLAMRKGDTPRLLALLGTLGRMTQTELEDAAASIPRTTFTEFFRSLDPFHVAETCDPAGTSNITPGMLKMLHLESKADEWGVRKLYSQLLQCLLNLMRALRASGQALHVEEYIMLLRCAGATTDIGAVKTLWDDLRGSPANAWLTAELLVEFTKARFSIEPLYTSHQKTHRMVTPRNLHRSRIVLPRNTVQRLDLLHFRYRPSKYSFGLTRDVPHVEEVQRLFRHDGPSIRLFRYIVYNGYRVNEELICAVMIAFGRAGSLKVVGTEILWNYFGIIPPESESLDSVPSATPFQDPRRLPPPPKVRLRPTVLLMRAIVETYGSNGEIRLAMHLVRELAIAHKIDIPPDVWQDLLEWTYIMSTPPASTAWKKAGLHAKVPDRGTVENIWHLMTVTFKVEPGFEDYKVLIRTLIARRRSDPSEALSHMREALKLYHKQCRDYEVAVFRYTQLRRDGGRLSHALHRLHRARFDKEGMWYEISTWCRTLLKSLGSPKTSPLPNPWVPSFIEEFQPFLKNPMQYRTPTGNVSLIDPALEPFISLRSGVIRQRFVMRKRDQGWLELKYGILKTAVISSHALADFRLSVMSNPLKLLAPRPESFYYRYDQSPARYVPQ
jgi:hypothetical protein